MKSITMKMKMIQRTSLIFKQIGFWSSISLALILSQKLGILVGNLLVDFFTRQ